MIKKIIVGIVLAGAVIGGSVYLATCYSNSTTSVLTSSKPNVVANTKVVMEASPTPTKHDSNINPVVGSVLSQLKDKGYMFVNITPKQLATFQGQPNTGMTPSQLNTELLDGFNGKLLSAGNLENSDYIVNATMDGTPVKVINMIDPNLLQTYSGNAFVCAVKDGKLVPLSEVQQSVNNGTFNVQESYPYKYFFTQDAVNDLANNGSKFLYGTFIG